MLSSVKISLDSYIDDNKCLRKLSLLFETNRSVLITSQKSVCNMVYEELSFPSQKSEHQTDDKFTKNLATVTKIINISVDVPYVFACRTNSYLEFKRCQCKLDERCRWMLNNDFVNLIHLRNWRCLLPSQ